MLPSDPLQDILSLADNARYLASLRQQIARPQGVIPFVGAGISAHFNYPGWRGFLMAQAQKAQIESEISALLDANDYEGAATRVMEKRSLRIFTDDLEEEFSDKKIRGKTLDGAVMVLPRLTHGPVITTNFDRVLERAFEQAGKPFDERVWGAQPDMIAKAMRLDRPFLLKLHGDVEERRDRVLTLSEYQSAYGSPASPLAVQLQRIVGGRTLLFVGCSLYQDRTIQVLRAAATQDSSSWHYAIVEYPADAREYPDRNRFLGECNIRPIWFPHGRFDLIAPLLEYLAGAAPDTHTSHSSSASVPPPRRNRALSGPHDVLLRHNTGFFGRADDVQKVLDFLQGSAGMATVTAAREMYAVRGAPGIGKSEVCKQALSQYLVLHPDASVYYVELVEARDASGLLDRLAQAFELSPDAGRDALLASVTAQNGVLYLDNLEDVLGDSAARDILQELANAPDMRVLASSREPLLLTARNFELPELDLPSALDLFRNEWDKSAPDRPLAEAEELRAFVRDDLDQHALSIVLVAAQARLFSLLKELRAEWHRAAFELAKLPDARAKGDSLEISLTSSLTAAQRQGQSALILWGLCAFFPEGMSPTAFEAVTESFASERLRARTVLLDLSLAQLQGGTLQMLAPLRQFILKVSRDGSAGIDFDAIGALAFSYFNQIAVNAKRFELGDQESKRGQALDKLLPEFSNLREFARLTAASGESWAEPLAALNRSLTNSYQFRSLVSVEILRELQLLFQSTARVQDVALVAKSLGDLENRLGELDAARTHYGQAIELYTQERANLGLANALKSLGDLENRLGEIDAARTHYGQAIALFTNERDNLGLANAFQSLGDLELGLKQYEKARAWYLKAHPLYIAERDMMDVAYVCAELARVHHALGETEQADSYLQQGMQAAQASNVPNVLRYVMGAIEEIHPGWMRAQQERALLEDALQAIVEQKAELGAVEGAFNQFYDGDAERADALGKIAYQLRMQDLFAQAEPFYRRALELDPQNPRRYVGLVTLLRQTSREQEALTLTEKWLTVSPDEVDALIAAANLSRKLGIANQTNKYLVRARAQVGENEWYALACIQAVAGETQAALDSLQHAADKDDFDPEWASRDPDLEWIRDHPRFAAILTAHGKNKENG